LATGGQLEPEVWLGAADVVVEAADVRVSRVVVSWVVDSSAVVEEGAVVEEVVDGAAVEEVVEGAVVVS
jgi:hypothetical protein